ncbi:MAG: hypothetical protein J7539_16055 [Niabella sp.]|nr:hypothetical protein [Niabella sp.]
MKTNSNTKYLLIGLVVLIWGLIIYKVIKGLSGDDTPPVVVKAKPQKTEDTATGYTLIPAAYPDPFNNDIFEGTDFKEDTVQQLAATKQQNGAGTQQRGMPGLPAVAAPPLVPPPTIRYSGYIYNPQTRKKTAMISFNGRGMTVEVNEKLDGQTKVLDITDQKLTISFNGKKLEFLLGG